MGEIFYKRVILVLLVFLSLFLFIGTLNNIAKSYELKNIAEESSVLEGNSVTGFTVHSKYSAFSAPEQGFLFNNISNAVSVFDDAIYRTGYYSINGSTWQGFNLSGNLYNGNNNWLTNNTSYILPSFGFGEHYIIVYSCSYDLFNGSWNCHDNRWQLVVINNTGSGFVPCVDNCSSLGYQCGTQMVCGNSINCGNCSTGYVCNSTGKCVANCTTHASSSCYNGDVYWYNSCNALEGIRYDCNSTQTCSGNVCVASQTVTCNGVTCASGEYCSNGVCLLNVSGHTYFVSTNGNDNNPGNFSHPWKTWQKAFNTADAGDVVYFRGGIWYPAESLIIAPRELPGEWGGPYYGHVGTAENPIRYFNYPGEKPIIDGSNHISENYPSIMFMFGAAYVEFKGITVRNLPQQPTSWMAVGIGCSCCSNFKFENMVVHDIGGRGYSWFSCMGYHGITEDTNIWINSDTYNCKDPYSPEPGNGGDCFKTVNEAGAYSIFQGCRAWNCSDDGYDLSGPNTVIVNNSWSFLNGFSGALDGNGFKSGGVNAAVSYPTRIITNNIAANNTGCGYFDLEYEDLYRNNARVYNNLFYSSGTIGILISDNPNYDRTLSVYRNNIIYVVHNTDSTGRENILDAPFYYTESHNTWDMVDQGSASWWDYADDITVADNDFVSLDVLQLMRPRKSDYSLPDVTFGHLAPGSDLIDAGTQIPGADNSGIILEYNGAAPDMGPFEYQS